MSYYEYIKFLPKTDFYDKEEFLKILKEVVNKLFKRN